MISRQVLEGALKDWGVKLLGFASPWWFLLLLGVPGVGHQWREGVGMLGVTLGSLWSLWVLAADEAGRARTSAIWFLFGLVSIPALLILGAGLSVMWPR